MQFDRASRLVRFFLVHAGQHGCSVSIVVDYLPALHPRAVESCVKFILISVADVSCLYRRTIHGHKSGKRVHKSILYVHDIRILQSQQK